MTGPNEPAWPDDGSEPDPSELEGSEPGPGEPEGPSRAASRRAAHGRGAKGSSDNGDGSGQAAKAAAEDGSDGAPTGTADGAGARPQNQSPGGAAHDARAGGARDQQIASILDIIGGQVRDHRRLEGQVSRVFKMLRDMQHGGPDKADQDPNEPGPWVWYSPPAPDRPDKTDGQDVTEDPQVFVNNFVAWHNITFVGNEHGRAAPIPDCWEAHPGLAMEVAAVAFSWRAANLGPNASERDAQYWLHVYRPGFAERMVRDWLHAECVDGSHHPLGARERDNRFVVNQPLAAPASTTRTTTAPGASPPGQGPLPPRQPPTMPPPPGRT